MRSARWMRTLSAPSPSPVAAALSLPFVLTPHVYLTHVGADRSSGIAGPIELRANLYERFSIALSVDQLVDLLRFATGTDDSDGLDYLSFVK
jgi:hypothetical protein